MKGHHKKYTLHCEALSPIHIGSGEILSRWEYVVIGNQLYYTTDEFWQKLREIDANAFNKLVESINRDDSASLTKEFDSLPQKGVLQSALEKSVLSHKFLREKNQPIIRSINRFAGAPDYYIPGSSIKGALRGAYEASLVEDRILTPVAEQENISKIEQQKLYDECKNQFSSLDSELSEKFQNIRIQDVNLTRNDLIILPVSYVKNPKQKNASELYESIQIGTEFRITVTETNKDDFFMNSLSKIFKFYKAAFRVLRQQADSYASYLENFYHEMSQKIDKGGDSIDHIIRCGYGSGQLCNSILRSWQEHIGNDTILWQGNAKKLLQIGKMEEGDEYPSAPKRDLIDDQPLGWIKVTKITKI